MRYERLLFSLVVGLHLVPIWAFTYFPSQDGPAHLANAAALSALLTGEGEVFQQYFVLNPMLSANWLSHLLLAGLLTFLPAVAAEKVLLSLCVVGVPVAARLALAIMRPEAKWLAVLTLPFVYSFTFHMGFYGFSLGLPLCLLYVAFHLRWREHLSASRLVALFLLGSVLYLAHIMTFDIALLMVVCLETWSVFLTWRNRQAGSARTGDGRFRINRLLVSLLPLLPAALIQVSFALTVGSRDWGRTESQVIGLFTGELPLVSFRPEERWLGLLVHLLFLGLILFTAAVRWRQRSASQWDGVLLAALIFLLMSFLVPNRAFSGGRITARLLLAMFFCLALWIGAHVKPRAAVFAAGLAATVLSLATLSLHVTFYSRFNERMKEFAGAAAHVEVGSTVLALNQGGRGRDAAGRPLSDNVHPFKHADGYLVAERRAVMLRNYEAHVGVFPLRFRPEMDPSQDLGTLEGYESYLATSPARIDYFLLSYGHLLPAPQLQRFKQFLAATHDLVYVSEPRGLVKLYRRHPD